MKKTFQLFAFVAAIVTVFFASCTKDANPPVAGFDFGPNDTIFASQELTFTNTSTNADTYEWDFGDGTTSTEKNPTKSYALKEEGPKKTHRVSKCIEVYDIILTASKNGKSSQVTKSVVVDYCMY